MPFREKGWPLIFIICFSGLIEALVNAHANEGNYADFRNDSLRLIACRSENGGRPIQIGFGRRTP